MIYPDRSPDIPSSVPPEGLDAASLNLDPSSHAPTMVPPKLENADSPLYNRGFEPEPPEAQLQPPVPPSLPIPVSLPTVPAATGSAERTTEQRGAEEEAAEVGGLGKARAEEHLGALAGSSSERDTAEYQHGQDIAPEVEVTGASPAPGSEPLPFDMDNKEEWNHLRGEDVAVTAAASGIDPEAEVKRTRLMMQCEVDVYNDDMRRFPLLTEEQRQELHREFRDVVGNPVRLHTLLAGSLIHDSGKSPDVRQSSRLGEDADHDEVYERLMTDPERRTERQRLWPILDDLPAEEVAFLEKVAAVKLNIPQLLQGEAPVASLEGEADIPPEILTFKFLEAQFDIFGARGNQNQEVSLTATPGTFRRLQNLKSALLDPELQTLKDKYNAFFDREIVHFMGPTQPQTPQELAELRSLARQECQLRVETQEEFEALQANHEVQHPLVEEVLNTELTRPTRATLGYYSPEYFRTLTNMYGGEFALQYVAHTLQEAHISDLEARRAGYTGAVTVQLGEIIGAIKAGEFDPRQNAIHFDVRGDALVAIPKPISLENLDGVPEFAEGHILAGKKAIYVAIGGGSDSNQADMLGDLFATRYGCQPVGTASIRSTERDRTLINPGPQVGTATRQITMQTTAADPSWRFLERIPVEDGSPAPMYLLNSSDPEVISRDVEALVAATGAEVVFGVDTGGDGYYKMPHASFSARRSADITPDNDYNSLDGLDRFAERHSGVRVFSATLAPGVDSPPYAKDVIFEIGAQQIQPTDQEKQRFLDLLARRRMDGSGSEEGRYGKTPFALMHALRGNWGFQLLPVPRANVTSIDNPWRAFTTITPAMAGIVIADLRRHFAAIKRTQE